MAKSVKKFILPVLALLIAMSCAMVGSLAYFTDSASIHAGIKTNKLTGSVTETTMVGTPDSDETWLESTTTVKDGGKVLFSALTTDYKDGLATKDSIKTFNVSRGNALSVTGGSALKTNQTFKVKFTNSNAADEIFYPEIHLTALDGKSLAQYEKVLGVADASAKATLDKTVKYQNVVNGTSEDLLTANIYTIPSLVNKTKVNSDGSLSLYLEGITVKAGAAVECSYALTENLSGHLDYSVPQVYVTTNATIRYPSAVNSLWYGTATAPSTTSGVIYSLAPDYQTRVLWKDVTGKYTVRGGQNAIQVTDKDASETTKALTEALSYTVATYQYTGADQTPTAYLFGSTVNTKLYKAVDGKWTEVHAAVERGSYKAVVDTSDMEGFAVSHTEFYFTITKAMSNVDFGNKPGPDGQPDPDNKTTWNGNTGDKEYDGKQVDIVGKDKDGNTITDFIFSNKDTGESSEIPPKDAGTYEVKPKGDDNHDYTNTATITIRKKTLQVTPTVNKNPLLPTDKPGFGYTVSGFAEGDNELDINGKNVQYIVDGVEAPSSGKSYAVGDHTLTCSGLTAKNYDFVYGITSFGVGKGTTTVDFENKPGTDGKDDPNNHLTWANANSATKVYDGVALSVQARDGDGNVVEVEYYTSDGKTKLDAAPKDVGIYVVKACDSENYTYSNSGTITITKATVHVTPVLDKTEMNYTDTVPANITYDIQGIVAGDEKYFDESAIGYIPYCEPSNTEYAAGMYNWTQKTAFRPTDYSYAGKYTLDACCEWHTDSYYCKSDNYMLDWGSATIQVNPIKLTPGTEDSNVTIKGDSVTKVYDGKPIDFKFVSTENKSYFNVAYIDSNGNELQSAPKDVGTYTVRPGKNLSKYGQIDSYPTIIITPAELTATAKTDVETYTPTKKPVLSYELSGFVNGESSAVVDASGIKYYVDGNDAEASGKVYATGTHTVSISGLTASNYTIKYVDATFTVGKQKVTVTYDESGDNKALSWTGDVATKVYDGKPAIITGVDSEGNVISDILYISSDESSSTTPPTGVGTYTIKPANSSEDFEYTNNGTLIITPAPLTVTVGGVTVRENRKPEFNITYSGLVNSETVDTVVSGKPTYTVAKDGTVVNPDSYGYYPIGEYTISVSGLAATNYNILTVDGKLTVEKLPDPSTIRAHKYGDSTDFMQYKNNITSITFLTEATAPDTVTYGPWDVSESKDGSITAWMVDNDVYIAGNGAEKINMPSDSSYWFADMRNLVAINGIDIIDTHHATDMSYMFTGCSSLLDLNLKNFNTSNVTNMRSMFNGCRALKSLNVTSFITDKVTDMRDMFNGCWAVEELNVTSFDTSNVTNMSYMFFRCKTIESLDVSSFNTSKCEDMRVMFKGCSNLKALDVSNFDDGHNGYYQSMFTECTALTELKLWTTSSSTYGGNMEDMFSYLPNITILDLRGLSTNEAYNLNYMFQHDTNLKTIIVSDKFTIKSNCDSKEMFNDCTSLVGGNGTVYDASHIDASYAHIDTADNPGYFTSITAKNSAEDETKPVVVNTDEVVDAAPTPEPEVEETVEPAESETTDSPAESSAESTAESESEESTTDETVTE